MIANMIDYYKYPYIAVTKPNAVLEKILSKHDIETFCLNCFCNFHTGNILKKHQLF